MVNLGENLTQSPPRVTPPIPLALYRDRFLPGHPVQKCPGDLIWAWSLQSGRCGLAQNVISGTFFEEKPCEDRRKCQHPPRKVYFFHSFTVPSRCQRSKVCARFLHEILRSERENHCYFPFIPTFHDSFFMSELKASMALAK